MPDLVFLSGPPASGKLTIAKALAAQTGLALFHNHFIVDAVGALFPFGSANFVRLREAFWRQAMLSAIGEGLSLIFTFAPEPTVSATFPQLLQKDVVARGGRVHFVRLTVPQDVQEQRLDMPDRAAFGKMRGVDLLRTLQDALAASDAAMPPPDLTLDTAELSPDAAAERIAALLA